MRFKSIDHLLHLNVIMNGSFCRPSEDILEYSINYKRTYAFTSTRLNYINCFGIFIESKKVQSSIPDSD